MIYHEVIREDIFRWRNPLLAEDLCLQPQLVVVAALETKLNNNNHRYPFGSMTLLI